MEAVVHLFTRKEGNFEVERAHKFVAPEVS